MKERRMDTAAMIFGLIFIGLSSWYFVGHDRGFTLSSIGWITAGLLILLGIVGITSAFRNAGNDRKGHL